MISVGLKPLLLILDDRHLKKIIKHLLLGKMRYAGGTNVIRVGLVA